jgi:hypothetical protein
MIETKQAWLYKDNHFERTEIEWEESIESNLDRYLEQNGFSCLFQFESDPDPLRMKLYQRDIGKEAKYPYEYLVVIPICGSNR